MPRRFFRKFAFKRHELSKRWFMAPFRRLMNDHRLWSIRRKTVVPAFSLGLFIAFLPFPGHIITAVLSSVPLRINIPVAALSTFACNPLTVGPMYYFAYQLGSKLLGMEEQPFGFEMSIDWVTHTFVNIWQPMLLGSFLLGSVAALVGYVVLDILWRISIRNYKTRKQTIRRNAESD
jgi:uncharacterized protein (DUF2062 family)